jgi:hypothetical protein
MLDPSAPPYNMNIPVAYPSNQQKNNYNRLNDTQIDDETIAINLHHQLNQTQNNSTQLPQQQPQVIIIKKNDNSEIMKVGCAAALLTFCCMQ